MTQIGYKESLFDVIHPGYSEIHTGYKKIVCGVIHWGNRWRENDKSEMKNMNYSYNMHVLN